MSDWKKQAEGVLGGLSDQQKVQTRKALILQLGPNCRKCGKPLDPVKTLALVKGKLYHLECEPK